MTRLVPARPLVIGLAGGIGAGKSHIARLFAAEGCAVSDSDALATRALDEPDVKAALVQWWGPPMLDAAGVVDRAQVARVVFADPGARTRLESLLHPRVHAARARQIEQAALAGVAAFVIDAPLLFEAGVDKECDAVVFIDCPRHERLDRVRARGWDDAELSRREAAQWPLERKRAQCRFAIDNSRARRDQLDQVRRILSELMGTPPEADPSPPPRRAA